MSTLENELAQMLNADRPTLVMFYSQNDPHSIEELPVFNEAIEKYNGEAHVLKIDADQNADLCKKYHVHAYPTFILFIDGQESWRATGREKLSELADMIHRFA